MPANTQLEYIDDGFKGILPQHFAAQNGTFIAPLGPFNDQNKEEVSRYVDVETCDFLVLKMNHHYPNEVEDSLIRRKIKQSIAALPSVDNSGKSIKGNKSESGQKAFQLLLSKRVILPEDSRPAYARAFYLPGGISAKAVKFQEYSLFQQTDTITSKK